MKTKLNIPTLILSAGLVTGNAFATSEGLRQPIEDTKTNTFLVLSGKDNMNQLKEEIKKNISIYRVQNGDTIAAIAARSGISIDELVNLNAFLDKPLIHR
jgi:LysM repeat protein